MIVLEVRSVVRSASVVGLVVLVFARPSAESRVPDGYPLSMLKANGWCLVTGNNVPSWETPLVPASCPAQPCLPATLIAAGLGRAEQAATLRGVGGGMGPTLAEGPKCVLRNGKSKTSIVSARHLSREPKLEVDGIMIPS